MYLFGLITSQGTFSDKLNCLHTKYTIDNVNKLKQNHRLQIGSF